MSRKTKRECLKHRWLGICVIISLSASFGCRHGGSADPFFLANPKFGQMTVTVAPAINLSGATNFDNNRFADMMASELSYTDGISVIPVSRVLGVLAAEGRDAIVSPSHALKIAELVGADAILVFSVTEYDPYDPPRIGISAQLYGTRPRHGFGAVDPVALSRQASFQPTAPRRGRGGVLAQLQEVYDASHESVASDIKHFALTRSADNSPFGWRKIVVNQQEYVRFCCYQTLRALFAGGKEPDLEVEVRKVDLQ